MSYESIVVFGLLAAIFGVEVAAFVYAAVSFREVSRNSAEIMRIQRAVAGLVTQESLKIQELMRS